MREYAGDDGLDVVAEYIEVESRAKLDRPALEQLRQAIAQGEFDVLICYDLGRLGSNPGHQILLEQVTVALDRSSKQRDGLLELYVDGEVDKKQLKEERKILRFLNIQGRVSKGQIYLSGCIPSWGKQEAMFAHRTFEPEQLPQLCPTGA